MAKPYNRQDYLYERAKSDGYRSRAAFKLIELNQRFKLFRRGCKVLDLGAWPGSWLQVAAETVGPSGIVVGIDLTPMESLDSKTVHLITGNVGDSEVIDSAMSLAGGPFHAVLSDMSPKLTGIPEADRAGTEECALAAARAASLALAPNGSFVVKLFKNPEADRLSKRLKPYFSRVTRVELDATRRTSNEWYLVGTGRKDDEREWV